MPPAEPTATVGRVVHYVAFGTPGGEYQPGAHRAAIITAVNVHGHVSLCVFNPTGLHFRDDAPYNEDAVPGTWHWPEIV